MNKIKLKNLIREILIETKAAAEKAHRLGLHHTAKGIWADKSGKKVAKTAGDNLIKYQEPEQTRQRQIQKYQAVGQGKPYKEPIAVPAAVQREPRDKQAQADRNADIARQMQQYQTVGREAPPQPSRQPVEIPAGQTTQDALAQRKMRQQVRTQGATLDVRELNPTWYNNLEFDLEEYYGISPDEISPEVMNDLYRQKLTAEEAAVEYLKIKNDVKEFKKKKCQQMHGENIMKKGELRKIIREIVADEVSLILEKWGDDVEVQKTGEHKDKSIEQLKKEMDAIEKKEPFNRGEWSERAFAVRAKQGWKKGTGSTGTTEGVKPSAGLSKSEKSAIVKKAKAGKDIGKKGKSFKNVAVKAAKGGAQDPEAVAAASMWKSIKR